MDNGWVYVPEQLLSGDLAAVPFDRVDGLVVPLTRRGGEIRPVGRPVKWIRREFLALLFQPFDFAGAVPAAAGSHTFEQLV
jgi:hypothetical protein